MGKKFVNHRRTNRKPRIISEPPPIAVPPQPASVDFDFAVETLDSEDHAEWLTWGIGYSHGSRVERRRSYPNPGWYVIGDNGATGPFATAMKAARGER